MKKQFIKELKELTEKYKVTIETQYDEQGNNYKMMYFAYAGVTDFSKKIEAYFEDKK